MEERADFFLPAINKLPISGIEKDVELMEKEAVFINELVEFSGARGDPKHKFMTWPFSIWSTVQSQDRISKDKRVNIGLAPFARHDTKSWPLDYMISLMRIVENEIEVCFHFFGGKNDRDKLEHIDFDKSDIMIHAGNMSPREEMQAISHLDLFISMDSANMHLADLLGIPVFSIWGATHPDLGFRPFNQPAENIIQSNEVLDCRPCSVFGNKACSLKDSPLKCLLTIQPEQVAEKILTSLSS